MKPKIAVFFHCLFFHGDPPEFRINAYNIISEQMEQLQQSGLLDECDELWVGCNGGEESKEVARLVIPPKAKVIYHGLNSKAENPTIVALHQWAPFHKDWLVLYFHAKGCTHPQDSDYGNGVSAPWRRAMMEDLVVNWKACVSELQCGWDIVCSHWMWNMADGTQHIPAGNFLWITGNFAANLPSMFNRERIKTSGISSAESRYEAEVHWGNGVRPRVFQMRPNGGGGVP